MEIRTIKTAGITFVNINCLSESRIRQINKIPYNHSLHTIDGIFTKVYDFKFKNISSRAGWAMVKIEDVKKYYDFDGYVDYEEVSDELNLNFTK